jgi:hypothetical protein
MLRREFEDPWLAQARLEGQVSHSEWSKAPFTTVVWEGTVSALSGASGVRVSLPVSLSFVYRREAGEWVLLAANLVLPRVVEIAPSGDR